MWMRTTTGTILRRNAGNERILFRPCRLPVPVLAIDRDGAIIFANEPFTQMLGYPTETVTTMKFDEIFSSMAATPSEQIVKLRHADGFTVRAKMSKSALLRGDDPVTLTTFQDLTEQLWTEGS